MTRPPAVKLLKFAYQLEGQEPEEVLVRSKSLCAWDETRAKRKWPSPGDAPFLWQTFCIWHALRTAGRYTGEFATFQDECVASDSLEDEDVDVDPTQQDELAS